MYKNTNPFFLILFFFSSMVLAASPQDLATIIDANPSFEVQDRASMGLGDEALVTSEVIQINLDSIRSSLIVGHSFKLHLPGDPHAKVFHVESVEENVPGVLAYSGDIDDGTRNVNKDNDSQFSFFLQGDEFLGKITSNGYVYIIQRDGELSDDFTISKIDPRRIFHDEDFDDSIASESSNDIAVTESNSDEVISSSLRAASSNIVSREIRVLFLFTNDVPSPNLRASHIITEFRKVLKNSGISLQHRNIASATTQRIDRDTASFHGCTRVTIRDSMRARTNGFEQIDTWLRNARADIAFLIYRGHDAGFNDIGDNNGCRTGGVAFNSQKQNPFGVSAHNYAITDLTAVHEIGHIFGGLHPDDTVNPGASRGSFAPPNTGSWQTIMGGYNDTCQFRTFDQTRACERIPRFSNQSQTHRRGAIGDGGHDMRSAILSPTGGFAQVAMYSTPFRSISAQGCTLNADGNSAVDALTDGILFIRHMFGLRGEDLVRNAIGRGCRRCTAPKINTFMTQCVATGASDIDGNGKVDALTDGLLITRYLSGSRGAALIKDSVGNNCTRCTAPEIVTYLQSQ